MIKEIEEAAGLVAEVIMFENWLRFYFISEEGDKLFIRLPEKAMGQIRQQYRTYYHFAAMLNNKEVDHRHSLKAVSRFISGGFSGRPLPDAVLAGVFDSRKFQLEMQLFTNWLQSHEEKLDERFMEFSEWQQTFSLWKNTDEVKDYAKHLAESMALAPTNVQTTTQ